MTETPEELPFNPHQAPPLEGEELLLKPSREYVLFQGLAGTFDRLRDEFEASLNSAPLMQMGVHHYSSDEVDVERRWNRRNKK